MKTGIIVSVVVMVAVAIAAVAITFRDDRDPGPLQPTDNSATVTGIAVDADHPVSIGITVPVPSGSAGLVLDHVSLASPSNGIVLEGMRVSTGRGNSFVCVGAARVFPPEGCRLSEVPGWSLTQEAEAHRGFQIVLGLSIDRNGTAWFPGVVIDYHDSGTSYRATLRQGGQLCAPKNDYLTTGCPNRADVIAAQQTLA
jgi:hypothetical protein